MSDGAPSTDPAPAYKRGQVEWALWRFVSLSGDVATEPPKVFRTRIKRLLELDRAEGGDAALAFADAPPEGQGSDVAFTAFDAFCLAIALDLLDAGFKQSEVVSLIRYLRPALRTEHDWILSDRLDDTTGPDTAAPGNPLGYDYRDFAVIQKVELTEIYATPARPGPAYHDPVFCHGLASLTEELDEMDPSYRKATVLEISWPARILASYLEEAPITKRGRK